MPSVSRSGESGRNDRVYDMRLSYDLENGALKTSGGNELFMNQFFLHRTIYYNQPEAELIFQLPVK